MIITEHFLKQLVTVKYYLIMQVICTVDIMHFEVTYCSLITNNLFIKQMHVGIFTQ